MEYVKDAYLDKDQLVMVVSVLIQSTRIVLTKILELENVYTVVEAF